MLLYFTTCQKNFENIKGILGGTYLKGYNGGDNKFDQKEYLGILKRTAHFYGLNIDFEISLLKERKPKF